MSANEIDNLALLSCGKALIRRANAPRARAVRAQGSGPQVTILLLKALNRD